METWCAIVNFFLIIMFCYIIYNSIPSKFKKLNENFGKFNNRRVLRFEFEKSPLHTSVYDGTVTGKTLLDNL